MNKNDDITIFWRIGEKDEEIKKKVPLNGYNKGNMKLRAYKGLFFREMNYSLYHPMCPWVSKNGEKSSSLAEFIQLSISAIPKGFEMVLQPSL